MNSHILIDAVKMRRRYDNFNTNWVNVMRLLEIAELILLMNITVNFVLTMLNFTSGFRIIKYNLALMLDQNILKQQNR